MGTFSIEVKLPEQLRELGFDEDALRREILELVVLQRFREGAISSGKGAQMLGVSRRDFLELLGRKRIPLYDPVDDELIREVRSLERLERSR